MSNVTITDIMNKDGFVKFPTPISYEQYVCVGYFPYMKAQVNRTVESIVMPREVFSKIEEAMQRRKCDTNKYIAVFISKVSSPFAIYFDNDISIVCSLSSIEVIDNELLLLHVTCHLLYQNNK